MGGLREEERVKEQSTLPDENGCSGMKEKERQESMTWER